MWLNEMLTFFSFRYVDMLYLYIICSHNRLVMYITIYYRFYQVFSRLAIHHQHPKKSPLDIKKLSKLIK